MSEVPGLNFKVTPTRLLHAVAWAAVCVGSYALAESGAFGIPLLLYLAVFTVLICPFVAIGAAIGHTVEGLVVAFAMLPVWGILFALLNRSMK